MSILKKIDLQNISENDFYWATGIEDTFIPQSEPGKRRLDEYELMQHYLFWKEDIDLASELGVQMMRYGIPWYKVNPSPGVYDWEWVDQVLEYLVVEKKIEPIIDLIHYGTPLWLENQFINPNYSRYVTDYATTFAKRYRSLVRYYTPLNEPYVNAEFCGLIKRWPPYLEGDSGFLMVMKNLCRGIVETVGGIRSVDPDAVMVHVEATGLACTQDLSLQNEVERFFKKRLTQFELVTGQVEEGHFLYEWLTENGLTEEELKWFRQNKITIDIMGLNYYPDLSVFELFRENEKIRQKPVWGGVDGLKFIITSYYKRYGRPIFITETSANAKQGDRSEWLKESVKAIKELRGQGIPVIGYTWFPLYDLINWDYREGTEPVEKYLEPMGLWGLQMGFDRVFRRVPTKLVDEYKQVIKSTFI
jgi:beta-glucosidase/6-phospho-beta-glucosidase/beta-galactosidase